MKIKRRKIIRINAHLIKDKFQEEYTGLENPSGDSRKDLIDKSPAACRVADSRRLELLGRNYVRPTYFFFCVLTKLVSSLWDFDSWVQSSKIFTETFDRCLV